MQNLDPLEISDVRVSAGVDVWVGVWVHAGEVIGVEVATGYDLRYWENVVLNILQLKTRDRDK